jgi:hypothetical protein
VNNNNSDLEGRVCFESRSGYQLLLVRASQVEPGNYYICSGNTTISSTPLVVSTDALGNFGELFITNNSTAAAASPGLALGTTQVDLTSVGIYPSADCSGSAILAAS